MGDDGHGRYVGQIFDVLNTEVICNHAHPYALSVREDTMLLRWWRPPAAPWLEGPAAGGVRSVAAWPGGTSWANREIASGPVEETFCELL